MKIYKQEKDISQLIKENKSISYISAIEKCSSNSILHAKILLDSCKLPTIKSNEEYKISEAITASIKNKNLYFYTAILATSSLNKNDDYFSVEELWKAKESPLYRPTNIEHEPDKIIGHTVKSFFIDSNNHIIDDNTEIADLPDFGHIVVGSVIYQPAINFSDDYNKCVGKVIEDIENEKLFISLECIFDSFNYILINDKETKFISRNNETSFLTKTLRVYGGTGEYNGYKVGRFLQDFTFCAHAVVSKPANPTSLILTKNDVFDSTKAKVIEKSEVLKTSGVSLINEPKISSEKIIMSDFIAEQNKELKDQNTALAKQVDELRDKFTKSNVDKLEKEIENLKVGIATLQKDVEKKTSEITLQADENKSIKANLDETSKKVDELTKVNTELKASLEKVEAEKRITARISTLIDGGILKEDATKKVEAFASLNDEQFNLVAQEIINAAEYKKADKKEDKKEDKKKEEKAKATEEDVEDAEVTDKKVTSASVEDDIDITELSKKLATALNIGDK